jgi:hypothetical protein
MVEAKLSPEAREYLNVVRWRSAIIVGFVIMAVLQILGIAHDRISAGRVYEIQAQVQINAELIRSNTEIVRQVNGILGQMTQQHGELIALMHQNNEIMHGILKQSTGAIRSGTKPKP